MSIIFLLAIFTTVSVVFFPARIKLISFPLISKNDYFDSDFGTIKILQDFTEDLGITVTHNFTQEGRLVASEGPQLACGRDLTTQFGSMVSIIAAALNRDEPNCPHPKGEQELSQEFDLDLIFDNLPAPSCGSNSTIDIQLDAPDVDVPILEMSFNISPSCDDIGKFA